MTIKDMERLVGITKANIRFYEKEGLLSPARSENNYRDYTEEDRAALEKVKYLRQMGITVSDIRLFQQGKCSLEQLLTEREKQLEEEAEALERLRDVCVELKKKEWDFHTFDTGLFAMRMELLQRKGEEYMKKDRISGSMRTIMKMKQITWYLVLCGIVSLLFFPINAVLKIPVSSTVMAIWPVALTLTAIVFAILSAATAGYEGTEADKGKRGETLVKRTENKWLRYEQQILGFNKICLASLLIIPFNRMLGIQWPVWLTVIWCILVFGSSIAVAALKNLRAS